ncbi:MAG TPA: hypothetical protein VKN99_22165 [Polyangia bacterium]|nr:hypothetical protein [Polyangia bacterium]
MADPYRGELEALSARCEALERELRAAQAQAEDADRLRAELAQTRKRLARLEYRARPWWKSPWALALYGLALAGFMMRPLHMRSQRLHHVAMRPPGGRCAGPIDRSFGLEVKSVHGAAGEIEPGAACQVEVQGAGDGSCEVAAACAGLLPLHLQARCGYAPAGDACDLIVMAPGFSLREGSRTGWLMLGPSELELRLSAP